MHTLIFRHIPRALLGILILATAAAMPVFAADEEESPAIVLTIAIDGQIEPALTYVLRRSIQEADRLDADALIFRMDTLGGRLDATEEICEMLRKVDRPIITFVEGNAISAGAIIALATPTIYMTPGSRIGDAMPILMGKEMGEAEREKAESFTDSLVRSNAEHAGHRIGVATAMVRRNFELKIGEDVISPDGQLLTLTAAEAARTYGDEDEPLLSEGTLEDFDTLLETLGYENADIRTVEVSGLEWLARIIATAAPLLMIVGMASVYLEIQSPGIGVPAAVAALCFGLFFFGHHIAGLAGMEEMIIFLIGILLLLVEVFVLPGFGITGMLGAGMILWSLLNAMMQQLPGDPVIPSWPTMQIPFVKLSLSIAAAGILIALLSRYLPRHRAFQTLVLASATSADSGFQASVDTGGLIGMSGTALTPLRPSGTAQFGELQRDVVTRGDFIATGGTVEIVEAHGNRLVVEARPDGPQETRA